MLGWIKRLFGKSSVNTGSENGNNEIVDEPTYGSEPDLLIKREYVQPNQNRDMTHSDIPIYKGNPFRNTYKEVTIV